MHVYVIFRKLRNLKIHKMYILSICVYIYIYIYINYHLWNIKTDKIEITYNIQIKYRNTENINILRMRKQIYKDI